ncbi:X-box-binding protein 1-like [Hetaerina americana]|uniref:X-box-binding protein 1-like n=1 Tax=Hetaerina americana TaxID=62018 RepID=UPI003A7F48FD
MESPSMVIIHVPQFARNIPVNPSTSSTRLLDDGRRVGISTKPIVTPVDKVYPMCTFNSKNNADDPISKMYVTKRKMLTLEDKVLRKKLKNRMAAQTSRDKKKARMEELEKRVSELQEKNSLLNQACDRLKVEVTALKEENSELKQKLCHCENVRPIEPAVFINDPLQKGQGLVLLVYMFLLRYFLTTLANTCSKSNNSLQKSWERRERDPTEKWIPSQCMAQMKWWGRQQRSWNPVNG